MKSLPLDDPRWAELDHRNWSEGRRSASAPDAPFVPDELGALRRDPADLDRFNRLWPWLCSEGTTWAAAYAAVPHVVELARGLAPRLRLDYLCFVGLTAACSCPERGESFEIKPYLLEGYRSALSDALALLAETLACRHDATDTRHLLAAAAALKGHPRLAGVLDNLDSIGGRCARCGEWVYPEEIQEALR